MKRNDIPPCRFIVSNDETEIFMELAIKNFKKHLQVMMECMGDNYKRHFYDRQYIEEVFDKVIERTKDDFNKAMRDDSRIDYMIFMDEIKGNLKSMYSLYCFYL